MYETGDYSDKMWSLHGAFSSREKAENYIREETTPPIKTEERLLIFEKRKEEYRNETLKRLSDLKESLPSLIAEADKTKDPNYNKGKIRKAKEAIEHLQKTVSTIDEHPYMKMSFQQWFDLEYRTPNQDDFSIIEEELK